MKALVIYESMFGSTRKIAESISAGLAGDSTVAIASVRDADARSVDLADLIVLGAPTHVHGLSMPATRAVAGAMAKDPGRHLELDEHAMDIGMREWLESIPPSTTLYAAFDTRRNMPRILTGAASVTIAKVLGRRGRSSAARASWSRTTSRSSPANSNAPVRGGSASGGSQPPRPPPLRDRDDRAGTAGTKVPRSAGPEGILAEPR
jgi:hypothetical protein